MRKHSGMSLYFAEHRKVRANGVDACIINHESKRAITQEMSCQWVTNPEKTKEEKTTKYGPRRWELKQKYQGYIVKQYSIIMVILGGWSRDLEDELNELVGSKSKGYLPNMPKAAILGTLNISWKRLKLQHE